MLSKLRFNLFIQTLIMVHRRHLRHAWWCSSRRQIDIVHESMHDSRLILGYRPSFANIKDLHVFWFMFLNIGISYTLVVVFFFQTKAVHNADLPTFSKNLFPYRYCIDDVKVLLASCWIWKWFLSRYSWVHFQYSLPCRIITLMYFQKCRRMTLH